MGKNQSLPRGILTQADRRFLAGEKELGSQSARNTRRRIRNRVFYALMDFSVLWYCLEDRDLELIFETESDERRNAIRRAIQDMIAFAILGLEENDDHVSHRLEAAIEQAAYARDRRVDITLEIEEEPLDKPDVIIDRLLDSGFKRTTYEEFERALTHPDADPKKQLQLLEELSPEEEFTVE